MTDLTADPRKQRLALPRRGGRGLPGVARRGLGGAHETREVIDVREPVGLGLVVRLAHRVAEVGHLVGKQCVGDPHLVEIGIAREGQKARVLILPAEAPDARSARGLDHRDVESEPADPAVRLLALLFGELDQGRIVDRLHEAVAEQVHRDAKGAYVLGVRHPLLNIGGRGWRQVAGAPGVHRRSRGACRGEETDAKDRYPHRSLHDSLSLAGSAANLCLIRSRGKPMPYANIGAHRRRRRRRRLSSRTGEATMSVRSVLGLALFVTALSVAQQPPAAQPAPAANPLDAVPDKMPFDMPYGAPLALERAEAAIAAAAAA